MDSNRCDFIIQFSNDLLANYNEQTCFATIHRNHKLLYILPFKINKKHGKYLLPIGKEKLFNGFNTITLFNAKNQPISQRHFYTETKKRIRLETAYYETAKDSVIIHFKGNDNYLITNLSILVLPKNTKLNSNAASILDAFLLFPYVDTNIPVTTDFQSGDLDMLLQTLSTKTEKHKFKNKLLNYSLENGVSIKGSINTEVNKNCKVLLSYIK